MGIGIGLVFPGPARVEFVGGGAFLPPPEVELDSVVRAVPFDARLPLRVPKDLSLFLVANPGPEAGGLIHSFDVKYRGRRNPAKKIHIWQTDNPEALNLLESEPGKGVPVLSLTKVDISGSRWSLVKLNWPSGVVTELGHRFDDGVTVSIDGQGLKATELMEVARLLVIVKAISSEWLTRLGVVQE